jgi:hypothetical protein
VLKDVCSHGGNGSFAKSIIPSKEFPSNIMDANSLLADKLNEPENLKSMGNNRLLCLGTMRRISI